MSLTSYRTAPPRGNANRQDREKKCEMALLVWLRKEPSAPFEGLAATYSPTP